MRDSRKEPPDPGLATIAPSTPLGKAFPDNHTQWEDKDDSDN